MKKKPTNEPYKPGMVKLSRYKVNVKSLFAFFFALVWVLGATTAQPRTLEMKIHEGLLFVKKFLVEELYCIGPGNGWVLESAHLMGIRFWSSFPVTCLDAHL